jgi:putative transposase
MIEVAIIQLTPLVGVKGACEAVGRPRASHYRARPANPATATAGTGTGVQPSARQRQLQPRGLSDVERKSVLDVLHSERFVDMAPAEIYATLLDEGVYLCSESTMYRLLRERGETRERRRQATHPAAVKPELVAPAPNRVWSWDITKLHGPAKWTYYYLYVALDIFSRYAVAWMVASRESAILAERMFAETIRKQRIAHGQLSIHADRGSSMASKPVAFLLADLGVTKSHSRPHVSNDNPFSEAQFKTLKYRPDFPQKFGCIEDARVFCDGFFTWYNHDHRHSGIGLHTPADVHHGRAGAVRDARFTILSSAYELHPERFVRKHPEPPSLPGAVWINKPTESEENSTQ